MKSLLLGVVLLLSAQVHAAGWASSKPRLVVVLVIDQFRADYISRFEDRFGKEGFLSLINTGAYFPYAEYDVLQSMTGPGHATILTGAYPYQMGIPLNDWYDQKTGKALYCVEDPAHKLVNVERPSLAASPRNLIGSTVGDELKNAGWPSQVVAVALKDRAAVLLGGHRANVAVWFDRENKVWATSDYYQKSAGEHAWIKSLNETSKFKTCKQDTPCGIEMTVEAAKAAMLGANLGRGKGPDILAVSFSSHDYAGHEFGPNSEEMKLMTLSEDKAIADLRGFVKAHVPGGLKDVVFVLTGDHGIAPTPTYLKGTGLDSGRIDENAIQKEMNEALNKKFNKSLSWIKFFEDFNFFLNEKEIADNKVSMAEVEAEMKRILLTNAAFAQVFTREEYEAHNLPPALFERKINRTYYRGRSGHVVGIQKPFYINETRNEANHMTGYSYDRTVPLIVSGFGIKHGLFAERTEVVDIAPTLSFLLGVVPPALSEGHVLSQILK